MKAYEVEQPYKRLLSIHDIMYIGNQVALYRVIGSPQMFVALTDTQGRSIDGVHELIVTERHKTPLYKQAMDMQMGRKPRLETQSRKVMRLQQISFEDGQYSRYVYYIARI